jgi:ribosomal protein S18 acetylase RimI-like enzyme
LHVCRLVGSSWQVYRAVRLAMLLDTPLAFGSTFEREIEFGEEVWRRRLEDSAVWMAARDTLPVGTVTLHRFPDQDPNQAQLVAMWVAAHARGSGVADALVGALLGHARASGLRRVTLNVAETNSRAAGLYERLGFVRTGRTGALPHAPEVSEFEMAALLDAGSARSW